MKLLSLLTALLAAPSLFAADPRSNGTHSLMPHLEDYTHQWWAEGFPSHSPAPWRRVIQTGFYAFALETESLQISHFGAIPAGISYAEAGKDSREWESLPPAELGLQITVEGKSYRAKAGGSWTNFTGPRLIESGRFFQRADVTNLRFAAEDGTELNVEARFETAAWPDQLGLILAARPGVLPIAPGESSFGRVGGGFGLDGKNHLEIAHCAQLDGECFTVELWAFCPADYQANGTFPWLVCKNANEASEGNYGIVILNGKPEARLNIGGGRAGQFVAHGQTPLLIEAWNHLAISYDSDVLRLYCNGALAGECQVGRKRTPGNKGLAFGRRQDNSGEGYHFKGVLDEIRVYERALSPAEIRERFNQPSVEKGAVWERSFRADGQVSTIRPRASWKNAVMEISLRSGKANLKRAETIAGVWSGNWREAALAFNPTTFPNEQTSSPLLVQASEWAGPARPVEYDAARGWHRINLDGIVPVVPDQHRSKNDAIERVKLRLTNPTATEQTARLLFEKSGGGFRQNIGAAITGISAMLRDTDGNPSGIPVQLSKNWHSRPQGGEYMGTWFHGLSQVRLPANASVDLELTIAYGHWGGVAAASHAQLCLIGWGANQRWDQSALGSWGESICYEPDQVQGQCSILDVRPVMVRSMHDDQKWGWTHNVGGGDFFRFFNPEGLRIPHTAMRTTYVRQGPCLTEVTYAGKIGEALSHSETVSLARTDDLVRGIYQLKLQVLKPIEFSRFVLFQIGADTYSYTSERKLALGDENGLHREWAAQWGGNIYRTEPQECTGRIPWFSMHEAAPRLKPGEAGAWANRGVIIRAWNARLGGKSAAPWVGEHGIKGRGEETSTMDILPPPGVTRLEVGDFIEATIEHVIVPQFAGDYYGPNDSLKKALGLWPNGWQLIDWEARANDRHVEMKTGSLQSLQPAVSLLADNETAEFTLSGGLGYVPITISGLSSPRDHRLLLDGVLVDQSVHGHDFWQCDYDPARSRWSLTYNLPIGDEKVHRVRLESAGR